MRTHIKYKVSEKFPEGKVETYDDAVPSCNVQEKTFILLNEDMEVVYDVVSFDLIERIIFVP